MTTGNWLIVHNTSGREELTALALAQEGYMETFYPYDETENPRWRQWMRRPKQRRGPKPPRYVRKPAVKGYTFVDVGYGDWYALVDACRRITERHEKLTLRVVAPGGIPYAVSDAVMLQMRRIPQRLQDLVDEAARAELEAEMARRPVVGGKAIVIEGPWHGVTVEVVEVGKDWVRFDTPLGKGMAPVAAVERA